MEYRRNRQTVSRSVNTEAGSKQASLRVAVRCGSSGRAEGRRKWLRWRLQFGGNNAKHLLAPLLGCGAAGQLPRRCQHHRVVGGQRRHLWED